MQLAIVDGASVYGYALQSPLRYTDPTGEFIPIVAALVIGAALLTPDAENAPGQCDLNDLVEPDPAAPFINGALAGIGFGQLGRAGSLNNWVRIKPSYSQAGGFKTRKTFTWGSNKHFQKQIQSRLLRRLNNALRNTRLPGRGWRTRDSGHFHITR